MSERGEEESRSRHLILEVSALLLLAFSVVLLVTNILPTRRSLARLRQEQQRLEEENTSLRDLRRRLDLKARALEDDPLTREAEFRRTFRTGKPGETSYQFEEGADDSE